MVTLQNSINYKQDINHRRLVRLERPTASKGEVHSVRRETPQRTILTSEAEAKARLTTRGATSRPLIRSLTSNRTTRLKGLKNHFSKSIMGAGQTVWVRLLLWLLSRQPRKLNAARRA